MARHVMSPLEFVTVTWMLTDPPESLAEQMKVEPTAHTDLVGQVTLTWVPVCLSIHWLTDDWT